MLVQVDHLQTKQLPSQKEVYSVFWLVYFNQAKEVYSVFWLVYFNQAISPIEPQRRGYAWARYLHLPVSFRIGQKRIKQWLYIPILHIICMHI